MRSLIRYLLFLMLIVLFSCEKAPIFVKCADCVTEEPETTTLEIKIADSHGSTIINIYSGNLEDNILLSTFEASGVDLTYKVTVNKKYTLTATYFLNGGVYIAVDSVVPRIKYETSQCSDPCYYVYDKKVNLRLKYSGINRRSARPATDHIYIAATGL